MISDLFTYGTLMCDDIMFSVTGNHYSSIDGVLQGYQKYKVRDEVYPAMLAKKKEAAEGVIYKNLLDDDWNKLDIFEGHRFDRMVVQIDTKDGSIIQAHTYILKSKFANILLDRKWSFTEFLNSGKEKFVSQYFGYDDLKN